MFGLLGLHAAVLSLSVEHITKPMTVDQYRADTPQLVRDAHVGPGDVVAVSNKTMWYLQWNVMREVYWDRVQLFDNMTQSPPADANIVIAPYDVPGRGHISNWSGEPTFHLVAVDNYHHWAIWRRN
jgi:hypothetical protein